MLAFPNTTLPSPTVNYDVTVSDSFLTPDVYDFYYSLERIIKQENSIGLNFEFTKSEYIIFEDFVSFDTEGTLLPFTILVDNGRGELKTVPGEIIGGIDVNIQKNRYSVSFMFLIKDDIIL